MPRRSAVRSLLAAILTAGIFAAIFAVNSAAQPRLRNLRGVETVSCIPDRPPLAVPKPLQWPMFGGTPQRNLVNPVAKSLPVEWNTDDGKMKNIKWWAQLGSKAYGGPAIADGRIFVGTNNQWLRDKTLVDQRGKPIDLGVIMCFREKDGAFLWQAVHKKLPTGQVNDWPREGICSTPIIEGGRFYYVSNRCELVCADVTNGKAIWTLDMIGTLGVFPHNMSNCSPLIVDDTIFIGTSNGVDEEHINIPAPKAPSFLAANKNTGKVLWQDNSPTIKAATTPRGNLTQREFFLKLVNRGELVMHGQWSNPAYAVVDGEPQVIFPGGDGWLYAFIPAGKLLWKFDCNPKDAKYEPSGKGTRNDFIATPVIYKNRVYIGTGQDPEHQTGVGHFWCIDMNRRGDVSSEIIDAKGAIAKNPNSALVWHYGGVITDNNERKKLQRNYYFGRTMSTCAIHDGLVYAADLGGWLHCLDADTGKVQWEHKTEARTWSSPYWADGKIHLGADNGDVFVFEHGRAKKLLAAIEMDGSIRTPPVALNGVLYVMTENRLYAIAHDK